MQIAAVDIGGTHACFAIANVDGNGAITLDDSVTLQTREHASFQTVWEKFAVIHGGDLPRAVAIAIAGPVGGETIRFTSNPWIIRPGRICEKLHVDCFTLVNEFGAVAHAVATAIEEDFLHLCGPDLPNQKRQRQCVKKSCGEQNGAIILPVEIFGEPAWYILLELYLFASLKRPVTVSIACRA